MKEVYVDEIDARVTQISYAKGQMNYYYFVKPGSTLDDGLFSFREPVNLELLKYNVDDHKLIDVYVEKVRQD